MYVSIKVQLSIIYLIKIFKIKLNIIYLKLKTSFLIFLILVRCIQDKDEPERWADLKRQEAEYERRRAALAAYHESVRHAQAVQIDDIPLPTLQVNNCHDYTSSYLTVAISQVDMMKYNDPHSESKS